MKYDIVHNPVSMVDFVLNWNESVTAEAGAMVYMRGDINTKTRTRKGGLFKTFKSKVLAGESFFVNEFTAKEDNCGLGITGAVLGDIQVIQADEEYIVQSGAYIASTGTITLDTKWQGFTRGIFGNNLFMLKTIGKGDVFVTGWGGIRKVVLKQGENMILDNYQLVAMSGTIEYKIKKHGSLKTAILGGEVLVIEIHGPGVIYYQTKNLMAFARVLSPIMPKPGR
ncbi:MAG: TIGR00266 family protein [Cenarchaeum sp. SB0665_bin_23]|nr:TIGR00266 family protein [Cenarchaeum sp. SB0665_bin_23]MYG32383.1 TIGR00266 family protein [Cenarchaeum sp. SB0677_bin_16]